MKTLSDEFPNFLLGLILRSTKHLLRRKHFTVLPARLRQAKHSNHLNLLGMTFHMLRFLAPVSSLCAIACMGMTLDAQEGNLDLLSPKADDTFEVDRPILFWKSLPGTKTYEVQMDGKSMGTISAGTLETEHYAVPTALPQGPHQWSVIAHSDAGTSTASPTSSFTVEAPGPWASWAIGPFVRYGKNPLLAPQGTGWESRNVYNPGVLFDGGRFRMLYRGQGRPDTSRVGYAESADGVTFKRNPEPLLDATEPFEQKYGLEDARFFKLENRYFAFYTGNNGKHIALCEATSADGRTWEKHGVIVDGTKNGALICDPQGAPVKINGKFAMYVGDSKFGIVYSDDLLKWSPITKIDMKLPSNWVNPYEPCIAMANHDPAHPDNVVLFIAGTLNGKGKWFYAISEVLFSKSDLLTKVDQLQDCILKAKEPYESGQFKNCMWMNCIIQHDKQWMIYYGAGDRNVGLVTAPVKNQ